jgi:hypothetical protein
MYVVDETGFPLSSGLETFIANAVKSTMASGKLGDSLINYSVRQCYSVR